MTKKKEKRAHTSSQPLSEMGKTYTYILCPFCGERTKAFAWSLARGKKCLCGAVHRANGITEKEVSK